MDVMAFQGEYRWLSNFWPAQVQLDGHLYPSIENAYQAAKVHPSQRAPFRNCTPGQAKKLGRASKINANWDQEKVAVMRALIAQKFAPGTELGERLRETGDGKIVEGNTWGDTFWGVCRGQGQNHLGRLLMERRAFLQSC